MIVLEAGCEFTAMTHMIYLIYGDDLMEYILELVTREGLDVIFE